MVVTSQQRHNVEVATSLLEICETLDDPNERFLTARDVIFAVLNGTSEQNSGAGKDIAYSFNELFLSTSIAWLQIAYMHILPFLTKWFQKQELDELISAWTVTQTVEQLISLMESSGVPAGLIYRAPEMLDDPHFAAREAIVRVAHPEFGDLAMQNVVPKLMSTPGSVRWAGPALGEHNDEIFGNLLGMSEERIRTLKQEGVI